MTRVTISVALIALESTQDLTLSLYVYMAVIIAKNIADSFNIGIYDFSIAKKDIPFLVDDLGYVGYQLTMEDVMTPSKEFDNTVNKQLDEAARERRVSATDKYGYHGETDSQYMATIVNTPTFCNVLIY